MAIAPLPPNNNPSQYHLPLDTAIVPFADGKSPADSLAFKLPSE